MRARERESKRKVPRTEVEDQSEHREQRHPPSVHSVTFRVYGSGFRVQGVGFRVQGSGFRVQGSGLKVEGVGFRGAPQEGEPTHGRPRPSVRASEQVLDEVEGQRDFQFVHEYARAARTQREHCHLPHRDAITRLK